MTVGNNNNYIDLYLNKKKRTRNKKFGGITKINEKIPSIDNDEKSNENYHSLARKMNSEKD